MKAALPEAVLKAFIADAKAGSGREIEIGGGNKQVDMTVLRADVEGYPELAGLVGGTIRIILNEHYKYVGHKVLGPSQKTKWQESERLAKKLLK